MEALQRLPTVGPKSAARLAFFLLQAPPEVSQELSEALLEVRRKIRPCKRCFNLADQELCTICSNPRRDPHSLCVVGDPKDIAAIEKTREFRGLYHCLGGLLNPLEGIGPDRVRIGPLLERVRQEPIQEIILATDPTVAGEATALYLHRQLGERVKVTRLALGVPVGSDLEYTDEVTLGRALRGRRTMEGESK